MTAKCPLTEDQCAEKITKILEDKIETILSKHLEKSPFLIAAEQHYKDHQLAEKYRDRFDEYEANHEWTTKVRDDLEVVKGSALKAFGRALALLFVGGISWKYLGEFFFGKGG